MARWWKVLGIVIVMGVAAGCGVQRYGAAPAGNLTALMGHYSDYSAARVALKTYLTHHAAVPVYLPSHIAGGSQPMSVQAAVSRGGYRVVLTAASRGRASSGHRTIMVLAAQPETQTGQAPPFFSPSALPPDAAQGEVLLSHDITGTNFTGGPVSRESQATRWQEFGWHFSIYSTPAQEPPDSAANHIINHFGRHILPGHSGYAAYRIANGEEVSEVGFIEKSVVYKIFAPQGRAVADAGEMVRVSGPL